MAKRADTSLFTLSKNERVSGRLRIAQLFKSQIRFPEYPLFLSFNNNDTAISEAALLVVVSSKKFKSAVARNRIKRLLREVFRLHKMELIQALHKHAVKGDISLGYMASKEMAFEQLETAYLKLIQKLNVELEKNTG